MKITTLITDPSMKVIYLCYKRGRPLDPSQKYVAGPTAAYDVPRYRAMKTFEAYVGMCWPASAKLMPLLDAEMLEELTGGAENHIYAARLNCAWVVLSKGWQAVQVSTLIENDFYPSLRGLKNHIFNQPAFRLAVRHLNAFAQELARI